MAPTVSSKLWTNFEPVTLFGDRPLPAVNLGL